MLLALAFARTAADAPPEPQASQTAGSTLERVSRYVEAYFARAQSVMVEETVSVQPVFADLSPDGFMRKLVYDLRVQWTPGSDSEPPRVEVVRELLRADNRPARKNREPKCLEPAPVTPEPLEFLLPAHTAEYAFTDAGRARLDGREAVLLDYRPRGAAKPKATADPKGTGDMDCFSLDVPKRSRGRLWIDTQSGAVLRIDDALLGPTEVPLPRELLRRPGLGLYITLMRSESTVRYGAVSFADPDETLMVPMRIDNVWVTAAGSIRGVRMTQEYRNYRRFLTDSRIVEREP